MCLLPRMVDRVLKGAASSWVGKGWTKARLLALVVGARGFRYLWCWEGRMRVWVFGAGSASWRVRRYLVGLVLRLFLWTRSARVAWSTPFLIA